MANNIISQAAGVIPPTEGLIQVKAITTASAAWQLTGSGGDFGANSRADSCFVTFMSDVDVYIVFGDSGVVALETSVSGDDQCALLPAYQPLACVLEAGQEDLYVAMKGVAAGYMRAWVSSVK